jgi:hypothetical protein
MAHEMKGAARTLFDFTQAAAVAGWSAIDDRVMGGVSQSGLRHDAAGHAVFAGTVSLERNGGFASVRAPAADLQAPGAGRYRLDVRGDGRRYKLTLRTDDAFDAVSYQAEFAPVAGQWTRVELPLSAFAPSFRGRSVPGAPPLDPGRVRQVGLMIADGQAGDFALALRTIAAAP